jgi:hypothetical protein
MEGVLSEESLAPRVLLTRPELRLPQCGGSVTGDAPCRSGPAGSSFRRGGHAAAPSLHRASYWQNRTCCEG